MQILKMLGALSVAVVSFGAQAGPVLQLGITNGSYDATATDIITTDHIFTLNSYGKAKGGNAVSLSTNYYLSVAVIADAGLNPAAFGSFMLGANTYTIGNMVFGNPPFETNLAHEGGDLAPHGVYDAWFMQYQFKFSGSSLTSNVDVETTPGFNPLLNAGKDYFYQSLNVNTLGLASGYNLHFDLFNTKTSKKGDVTIDSHAPFSHDASTAYVVSNPSSVPEPSTLMIFGLALAGLLFSRRLVWPSPVKTTV